MLPRLVIFIFILGSAAGASAQPCLDLAHDLSFAGHLLEYREKKTAQPLAEAVFAADAAFLPVPDAFASFGYTSRNFILRFRVCPPAQRNKVFVRIDGLYPQAEAFFLPDSCPGMRACAGETGKRIEQDRNALFVFDAVTSPGRIYLDAVPPGSRRYPVFAATAENFFSAEKKYLWATGLFFGALLTIFVYNLALYLGLKEKINLFYSAYLLLFMTLFLTLERIPEAFAGHSGNLAYLFFRSALFPAMLIPFALFNREFLSSVAGRYQNLSWHILIAADVMLFALNFVVDYRRMMPLNIVMSMVHCTLALLFIVRAIALGFRPAWLMFLGWLFFLGSSILSSFHMLGKFSVTYNDYMTHMMKFGSLAENLLFTIALGVRVRFYKSRAESFAAELAAEREALARDLHDVLGSEFGQIQLKLTRTDVPADIAAWLGRKSRGLGNRLRDIIFLLRRDLTQKAIRDELDALLSMLGEIDGFHFSYKVDDRINDISAFLLLDALRIIQEWSGNCMRHGKPSRMDIRLQKRPYGLRLAIMSDGTPFRWSGERYGLGEGLAGIRMRAVQRTGFARARPLHGVNIFLATLKTLR